MFPASLCGSGNWYKFNGYCYMPDPLYGRDSAKTWYDAQNYCNANGGGLADIHSKAENDFVFSLVGIVSFSCSSYFLEHFANEYTSN